MADGSIQDLIKVEGARGRRIAAVAFMLLTKQVYKVTVFYVCCKCTVVEYPRPNARLQQQS